MPEHHAAVLALPQAAVVRAAVGDLLAHRQDERSIAIFVTSAIAGTETILTDDTAHQRVQKAITVSSTGPARTGSREYRRARRASARTPPRPTPRPPRAARP